MESKELIWGEVEPGEWPCLCRSGCLTPSSAMSRESTVGLRQSGHQGKVHDEEERRIIHSKMHLSRVEGVLSWLGWLEDVHRMIYRSVGLEFFPKSWGFCLCFYTFKTELFGMHEVPPEISKNRLSSHFLVSGIFLIFQTLLEWQRSCFLSDSDKLIIHPVRAVKGINSRMACNKSYTKCLGALLKKCVFYCICV